MNKLLKSFAIPIVVVLLFQISFPSLAQQFSPLGEVRAELDTTIIMIGDHFTLKLEAEYQDSAFIQFPVFTNAVVDKIEILRDLPFDTLQQNGKKIISKRYKLTCFDSGNYVIDSLAVIFRYKNQTERKVFANPVAISVQTFQIDSTERRIADIKPPIDTPLTFREFINEYLPYGLVAIAIVAALILGLWLYSRKKAAPIPEVPVIPVEEAHVVALRELEQLEQNKLWQKGEVKEYYALLSLIIRRYIENRWHIPALESVTSEIRQLLKAIAEIDKDLYSNVMEMLEMSDMVKFAKFQPLPSESIKFLEDAYNFVRTTRKIVEIEENQDESSNTKKE
ncbi:MAG TPA: hypothetical protein PK990_09830 [Salinivirgaceae bacterium]|nr:hypothetical protein [Salinivirgaceae bacterium]